MTMSKRKRKISGPDIFLGFWLGWVIGGLVSVLIIIAKN